MDAFLVFIGYTMLVKDVTVAQIKKIVDEQINKFIKDSLKREIATSLKQGAGKVEMKETVKDALNNLYKYMWTKRSNWNNELR